MSAKTGRNQPCPCGSGLKFKKCHGRLDRRAAVPPAELRKVLDRRAAQEHIRQTQQGLGRPIISARIGDHQVVAVGDTIRWSKTWKTFPDFLGDYIRDVLGRDWGNAELGKPFDERHPLIQWYDAYCRYQQRTIPKPGEPSEAVVTGIVACWLGTAYALYLLQHNAELQARLVHRLKDPRNFQGAYYELIVASMLIRSGFTLTLENESDPATKHCEFAAVSQKTGKRYWVEAKMRSVAGMFGKTDVDGGADGKPLSRLVSHLNGALAKPARDERLIFIDLNTEPTLDADGKPIWFQEAVEKLERYERDHLKPGVKAYVFVTNTAFHRQLDQAPLFALTAFGLGMRDFNRPGMMRLSEAHRRKVEHIDAHHIAESSTKYLRFPTTFDGRLPSEVLGLPTSRVQIGETYHFTNIGEHGIVGRVTTAAVIESEKAAYIGITDPEGRGHILKQPMSDADFTEYLEFRDAYFGRVDPVNPPAKDNFELFEWFMQNHKDMPREKILEAFASAPNLDALKAMSDADLRAEYCEAMVASIVQRAK